MSFDEFLNNPDEKIVYEGPDSDTFIETLAEIYRNPQIVDDNEVDEIIVLNY